MFGAENCGKRLYFQYRSAVSSYLHNSPINVQNRKTHLGVLRFFSGVGCITNGYRVLSLEMIAGGGGFQKGYEIWVAC